MPPKGRSKSSPRVLVVAPAYNESGKIGAVVRDVLRQPCVDAMVVVDDCSSDATGDEASEAGATVLRHAQNRGAGAALRTGIQYGVDEGFDIVAIVSGDGQHVADELERVVRPVADGSCDLCQASRFADGGNVRGQNAFRTSLIRFYSLVFTVFTGTALSDATNGMRAFRTSLLAEAGIDLDQGWLDRYELEPYLLYRAAQSDARMMERPCTVIYPEAGSYSHMRPFVDWWKLFRPLVFLRFGIKR